VENSERTGNFGDIKLDNNIYNCSWVYELMTIKEFSEKLLRIIYENRKMMLSSLKLAEVSHQDKEQINETLHYLKDKGFIELGVRTLDSNYHFITLKAKGIDFVEEEIKNNEGIKSLNDTIKMIVEKIKVNPKNEAPDFDFFICHASEDKKDFVDILASRLIKENFKVWYDNFIIKWGDDLKSKIDEGLKKSKYGIVVFSKDFLKKKKWTEYELKSLFALEGEKKKILPIWHNVIREEILEYSPYLADKLSIDSQEINKIIQEAKKLFD
jgi:hypothetical protein